MQILGYMQENIAFNSERFFILLTTREKLLWKESTFHFQMKNMLKLKLLDSI